MGPSSAQLSDPRLRTGSDTVVLQGHHFSSHVDGRKFMQVGFLIAALATAYFASLVLDFGAAPPDSPLLTEAVVCLTACVALGLSLARMAKEAPRAGLADFGYVSMFLLCVVLSVFPVRFQELRGLPPPRVTLTCLAVAAYPAFMPGPHWKTIAFAILTSATQPLALVVFSRGHAGTAPVVVSTLTASLAALTAILGSRVLSRINAVSEDARVVGSYRLTRRIGHGPNTETWRAEHHLLARPAALTLVKPRAVDVRSSPSFLHYFEREAQAVASLTSPHTVTLFEFGVSSDGHVYHVTELPEGRPLAVAIEDQGPFSTNELVRIALELCDSLAEAHEHGIVHGHLSANTVLLCRVGGRRDHVKVIEYGINQVHPGWGYTDADFRGVTSPGAAGFSTDVIALGHLLELMATGRYNPTDMERAAMQPRIRAIADRCIAGQFADAGAVEAALLGAPHASRGEVLVSHGPPQETAVGASREASAIRTGRLPKMMHVFFNPADEFAAQSSLSSAQLSHSRQRLGRLAECVFAANLLGGIVWALSAPQAWRPSLPAAIWVLGLGLDVMIRYLTRDMTFTTHRVLNAGLAYACARTVVHTALAVLVHDLTGAMAPSATFAGLAVVAYPLIVPTPPRRMLFVAITSALAIPALLFLLADPPASSATLYESTVIAAVAVGLSYVVTTTAYGLTVMADRSRELGSYELLEIIGRGAMGEVWRARHQLLARPAALKMIRSDRTPSDPRLLDRLWREARITARLSSPHTVRLFDYGVTEAGTCYFAMELLHGIDLQELVERTGPVSPERVIEIALEVCDSLNEAHALGLVHRDLKPSNLFQCQVGRRDDLIKVLDFGLVRLSRPLGEQSADDSTTIVGTPAYMAPETLLGQTVDARADIYAFGAVMFFLLSGQHVFDKASAVATVLARLHESAPSVAEVASRTIPAELDAIISRCLMRDPAARYQTIAEVEAALLSTTEVAATPWGTLGFQPELVH